MTSSPADERPDPIAPAVESELRELELSIPSELAGKRLDAVLAELLKHRHCSRSFLSRLLKDGSILLNCATAKPNKKVKGGEIVAIEWPEPESIEARPEEIPLSVLYEDTDLIVIDKPAGMVTHPSSGHSSGTLVNALLWHCKDLSSINGSLRPGIVHRLDRDTSGCIVAAKNDRAHQALQEQFAARSVKKEYLALCHGNPEKERFTADGRIGRHPTRRMEMTVMRHENEGREARTDFTVCEKFSFVAQQREAGNTPIGSTPLFLVRAFPHTGRTHQIRVHLAKLGFPICCDFLYGKEATWPELQMQRQALHAARLSFTHPRFNERMTFEAEIPVDLQSALKCLR